MQPMLCSSPSGQQEESGSRQPSYTRCLVDNLIRNNLAAEAANRTASFATRGQRAALWLLIAQLTSPLPGQRATL